jgi:hypothetical protein
VSGELNFELPDSRIARGIGVEERKPWLILLPKNNCHWLVSATFRNTERLIVSFPERYAWGFVG